MALSSTVAPLASESYLDLVLDPAHIAFELTYDVLTGLLLLLALRPLMRRLGERIHARIDRDHAAHAVDHAACDTALSVVPSTTDQPAQATLPFGSDDRFGAALRAYDERRAAERERLASHAGIPADRTYGHVRVVGR
jgi:hypothetical protein